MVNPTTPMKDPDYDVVLLLQQALEDARKAGDQELVDLFEELAESDREISERVKKILAERLS